VQTLHTSMVSRLPYWWERSWKFLRLRSQGGNRSRWDWKRVGEGREERIVRREALEEGGGLGENCVLEWVWQDNLRSDLVV
jgi:hypothetical protein